MMAGRPFYVHFSTTYSVNFEGVNVLEACYTVYQYLRYIVPTEPMHLDLPNPTYSSQQ